MTVCEGLGGAIYASNINLITICSSSINGSIAVPSNDNAALSGAGIAIQASGFTIVDTFITNNMLPASACVAQVARGLGGGLFVSTKRLKFLLKFNLICYTNYSTSSTSSLFVRKVIHLFPYTTLISARCHQHTPKPT